MPTAIRQLGHRPPARQQQTAHENKISVVHYPLHWLHGQQVEVERRCPQYGPGRIQVLPPDGKRRVICDWMLDEAYCKKAKTSASPVISVDALAALWSLLDLQVLLRSGEKAEATASLNKKGASDAEAKAKAAASTEEADVGSRESVERTSVRKAKTNRTTSKPATRSRRQGRKKG